MAWFLILAVALAVRLGAGFWWESRLAPGKQFFFPDSDSYWQLGQAVAHGDDYAYPTPEFRVFRAPGYPLLLAGLFRLFGDAMPVMAARALSAVLGVITVAVVGWWTTQLFDARAGRIAGWIGALYPGGVSIGAFVLSEAPFCLLMLLQLALWSRAWSSESPRRAGALAVAAGMSAAMATLMRPSWLLFAPVAVVVSLAFDKRRGRQAAIGLAMCASLALGMLPWWIRNARVTGHFVPTTLQVGASLYDGLSPTADGSSNLDFVDEFAALERARASDAAAPEDTFEYRLDRRLWDAAIGWAFDHPRRVAELAWTKFRRVWNVWPNEPALRGWPLRLAVSLSYAPLLCFGLIGAARYTRRGWPYLLAWLPAIYLTLLHVIFVGSIRYREPAMLALTVLAAGLLADATGRGQEPRVSTARPTG